jgi:hypothetical protein
VAPLRAEGNSGTFIITVLAFLLGIVGTFAVVGVRSDAQLTKLDARLSTLELEVSQIAVFTIRKP